VLTSRTANKALLSFILLPPMRVSFYVAGKEGTVNDGGGSRFASKKVKGFEVSEDLFIFCTVLTLMMSRTTRLEGVMCHSRVKGVGY
jgi:hypothetical protein